MWSGYYGCYVVFSIMVVMWVVSVEFAGIPVVLLIRLLIGWFRDDLMFVHEESLVRSVKHGNDFMSFFTIQQWPSTIVTAIFPFAFLIILLSMIRGVFSLMIGLIPVRFVNGSIREFLRRELLLLKFFLPSRRPNF